MIKYASLPLNSFKSICRTCLMHGELFTICEVNWEEIELEDILVNLTLINNQVKQDDQLPKQMCKNCIKMMYTIYHFIYKCKTSDRILRKIVLKSFKKAQNEEGDTFKQETTVNEQQEPKNNELDNKTQSNTADPAGKWDGITSPVQSDNDIDIDDPADVESKGSTPEDTAVGTNSESKLITKINNIKEQITKIRVKNKVRLRQMAKAQLVNYNNFAGSNKRSYVFRKGPPYTCITCNSSYQTHEELRRHKIDTKHKKALKYKCEYCERKWDTYCKYEEHVRTHTGEKPNKCSTCGKCFNFKTDLKRHMAMHMEVKPYVCRFCSKGFIRRQYLADHERKHTGEQLICPFCGKGFHSYSTLSYHEKTHKGPPGCVRDPLTKDKLYQCHLCDKTLLTEHTLKAHILLHGPRNFSCEICGKTYISNNRLQDHIRLTHQENRFSCHLCSKEYKQKSGLEVHLKSHSGENNYPCDVCGKHFACKGSLYQHKRVHTGDTKYQCKECFHISINRRNLENHLRIHTGEKPFACIYCGKFFAQKANMKAHTKIHTGERNHLCELCDKAFYDTRGLKKHMAVHEKNGENGNNV